VSLHSIFLRDANITNCFVVSSYLVCKKVEEKGQTTYNEVADELVNEFMALNDQASDEESTKDTPSKTKGRGKGGKYDEKNIRRRVYDALNVLMAMDIISKEKKEIKWKGLPNSSQNDLEILHREKARRIKELQRKRESLRELLVQQICYRNLVNRNREREAGEAKKQQQSPSSSDMGNRSSDTSEGAPGSSSGNEEKIPVPFIVVNTSSQTVIQCEMGPDRTDVFFNFSKPFEINDDNEILKRLGMHKTTIEELRRMLPREIYMYCHEHRMLDSLLLDSDPPPGHEGGHSHFGTLPLGAPGGYRIPGLPGTHGIPSSSQPGSSGPYRYDQSAMAPIQQPPPHMAAGRPPAESY